MSFRRLNTFDAVKEARKRWAALLSGLTKGEITVYPYDRKVDGIALSVCGQVHVIRDLSSDMRIADQIGSIARRVARQAQSQDRRNQIAHFAASVGYAAIALGRIADSAEAIRSFRM